MTGHDIAAALVEAAHAENATQIVLGATNRSRWHEIVNGSIINRVVRLSGLIDVHVISERPDEGPGAQSDENEPGERRLPSMKPVLTPLSPRRQAWGWAITLVGLPLLTLLFANARDAFGLTSVLLLYLVLAMVVALVGGVFPAAAAVVGGMLLANWYFTPPFYELTIHEGENLLALIVFAVAAGMVAVLVDRVGRSRIQAAGPGRKPRRSPRWPGRWPVPVRWRRCSARCAPRSASARPRCCDASRRAGSWWRHRGSSHRWGPTKPTSSGTSAA